MTYHIVLDLYYLLVCACYVASVVSNSMDCGQPGSTIHGDSPGKNTGVGFRALLQESFPAQGSNSHL